VTIDESFRATSHVIGAMQIEVLRCLQLGTMNYVDAQQLLAHLEAVQIAIDRTRIAASEDPEPYGRFAVPGQAANKPSEN
jgi:hypothetical protein